MISNTILWAAVILFTVAVVLVGLIAMRKTRNTMDDYVLGGRVLGPVAGFFTVTATLFSAFSYFGITGWFYSDGVGAWHQVSGTVILGFFIYFAGTRIWALGRYYRFINVTDYIGDRYGSPATGGLAGLVMIAALVPYIGAQFRGAGITLTEMSGGSVPFWIGAVFLAAVVVAYVMAGGFRSVVWTDVIQGVVMYVVLIAGAFIIVRAVSGDASTLMTQVQEQDPALLSNPGPNGLFAFPYILSIVLIFSMADFVIPQLHQRWLAARSAMSLKKIAISLAVGTMVVYTCNFFIAMAGRVHLPNLENPETVYPALIAEFLPPVLLILAVIGILAATASTANSTILTIGSMVANDYWRPIQRRRGKMQETNLTTVTRVLLPFIVVASLVIAIWGPPQIVGLIVDITWPAALMVFPAVMGGLYWRRATAAGAASSMIVGILTLLLLTALPIPLAGWAPGIPAVIVAIVTFVAVSLLTRPAPAATVERHFAPFDSIRVVRPRRQTGSTA